MTIAFLQNGALHGLEGNAVQNLMRFNMDPGCLRPWYDSTTGQSFITVNHQGKQHNIVVNAPATLRKDEWIHLDQVMLKAAKQRLKALSDIRAAGLTYTLPNGMAHTSLEYQKSGEIQGAEITMDGITRTANNRMEYELFNLPLPLIHKDFNINVRQLLSSRNTGAPFDASMGEEAAREVAVSGEKLLLGTAASYKYAGANVYGYTNFPQRLTKVLTSPDSMGWTPATLVEEVIEMRQQSIDALHYGPWKMYNSPAWDIVLDQDFSAAKGDITLRDRLAKIKGISPTETLDYLSGYQILLIQQTSNVARLVIGFDLTTVQWETHGGFQQNFKVMAMWVPQLRCDINNRTGIVHGTAV